MAELLVVAAIQALTSALPVEEIVTSTVTFLGHQLSLITGAHKKMNEMKRDLESIQSLLCLADQKMEESRRNGQAHEDSPLVNWVRRVRDVSYDVEDILDNHMYDIAKRGGFGGGLRGVIKKYRHKLRLLVTYRRTGAKLERIRPEVEKIMTTYDTIIYGMLSPLLVHGSPYSAAIQEGTSLSSSSFVRPDEGECFFSPNERGVSPESEMERWILEHPIECDGISPMNLDVRYWMGIAIWGMGGVGKTTLLRNLYFKEDVNQKFDCCSWVTVSRNYRVVELLQKIIKDLENPSYVDTERRSEEELIQMIHSILDQRRYLIVFDDVWDDAFWRKIQNIFRKDHDRRSRILLTTRDKKVASSFAREDRMMNLDPLRENEAWLLFCKKAFWKDPTSKCPLELEPWARRIVAKCGGLPLAIVVVAGMMSRKERNALDWERSYKMLSSLLNEDPQLSIILHSYYALPSYLKRCFLYISTFPEGCTFGKEWVTHLWIGEGFIEESNGMTMEDVAEAYLRELVERSMIEKEETRQTFLVVIYRMHDLLRAIALDVSREQKFAAVLDEDHLNPGDARRLSIHKDVPEVPMEKNVLKLRSLSVFTVELSSFQKFRLLKVLNLIRALISNIPKEIFDLFNLRYLSLRDTRLNMDLLSKRIGRLKNLLYLDIYETNVLRLPLDIVKLRKLRHLCIGDLFNSKGCRVPMDICLLKDLQILDMVEASEQLVERLGELTQLRRIGITNVRQSHVVSLSKSLERLVHLKGLRICMNDEDIIDLDQLNPPSTRLQQIFLVSLKSIPAWFQSLGNLTELAVHTCMMKKDEDPLRHLRYLPCLEVLLLGNVYEVLRLSFPSKSFPSLRLLNITDFANLKSIEMDDGALPRLGRLRISNCKSLTGSLPRVQNLASLNTLNLEDMAEEIVREFREMCNQCTYLKLMVS